MTPQPAVVLLSGGLDSATTLAIARHKRYEAHALSFRYGQRHAAELDAARKVAVSVGAAEHVIADIDLRVFGGSALTDGIPATYVPARNTIFLSYALAWAEVLGARDIFIGVNVLDYSGYPDCRPEYIAAFERMANLATAAATGDARRMRIRTPLISSTKAEVIQIGASLGVDFSLTWSCYEGGLRPCRTCDACLIRQHGFAESGMEDPCIA